MSSTFAPDGERRLPAARPGPRREPQRDRAPLASTTPTPTTQYNHDMEQGLPGDQAAARRAAAGHLQRRPRGAARARRPRLALHGSWTSDVLHNAVRLLTGSAADFLDDYFESRHPQGLPRLVERSSARRSGRARRAPGSCCSTTRSASTTASSARGRSTRAATAASPRCWPGRRSRSARRSGSSRRSSAVHHEGRPGDRRRPRRRHGVPRHDRRLRARPAADVPRARRPARAARPTSSRTIQRFRFQGTSSKVNFALDGLPEYPALGDRERPVPRLHEHRAVDGVPRARLRRRASTAGTATRPYIDCAIQSTIDPDMAPPGKHVMSCFIQYTPYQLRESDWDTEKENLGDTVQATLESFFPGFGDLVLQREVRDAARHRADGRPVARATSSPASSSRRRCSSSARRRAGRSTARRSTATTSAAPGTHPGRLRHGRARASSRPAGSSRISARD